MKKFLVDIILFSVVLTIISAGISFALDKVFGGKHYSHTKHNWVLATKNTQFDYAALGSSRVLNVIDVPLIDSLAGKSGINIATSGSGYADNYVLLKRFYESGNKTKTLFLNVDEYCFDAQHHYSYPFADFEYMPFFYEPEINSAYSDCSSNYYLWKYLPFSRYAEFSDKYKLQNLYILRNSKSNYDYSKGYEELSDSSYKEFKTTETLLNTNKLDLDYFFKVIALCKENNTTPILITTPEYYKLYPFQKNRAALYKKIYHLKDSLHLKYIHYDSLGDFSNISYFKDYTHTNSIGANLYSERLASLISQQR